MSTIGHVCAMLEDEDAPAKPRFEPEQRVRVVGAGVAEFEATIKAIRGSRASIRDDDGNLYSAALDNLEPAEDEGAAA